MRGGVVRKKTFDQQRTIHNLSPEFRSHTGLTAVRTYTGNASENLGSQVLHDLQTDGASPTAVKQLECWPEEQSCCANIYSVFSDPTSSFSGLIMSIFITLLIVMSSITFVLETLPQFRFPKVGKKDFDTLPIFDILELIAILCFTVEYSLRLFTANSVSYENLGIFEVNPEISVKPKWCSIRVHKTWIFFKKRMNLVDLFAIVPYYIGLLDSAWSGNSLSVLRILRLARVFRVFKIGKYSEGALLYSEVLKSSAEALYLLIFFSFITSVVMGSLMYSFERGEFVAGGCVQQGTNPPVPRDCFMRPNIVGTGKEESPFTSIPQAFWWYVPLHCIFIVTFELD